MRWLCANIDMNVFGYSKMSTVLEGYCSSQPPVVDVYMRNLKETGSIQFICFLGIPNIFTLWKCQFELVAGMRSPLHEMYGHPKP